MLTMSTHRHHHHHRYDRAHAQGYFGVSIGKGARAAKTEIEKLKLSEMTAREAIKEAAKMYLLTHTPQLPAFR